MYNSTIVFLDLSLRVKKIQIKKKTNSILHFDVVLNTPLFWSDTPLWLFKNIRD